ncbi:MAG: hypothetical protein OXN27_04435 [Candidatus Poribacteria bacterium]|nr:hypothetical protein [Candidatus Poribacteria bacterium]
MNIQSINIINLSRRGDLKAAQLDSWAGVGFSEDEIIFHEAIDGLEYDSHPALCEDAIADGFQWFSHFNENSAFQMGVGELACMWSIARLLRYIAEQPDGLYIYCLADRYSKKQRDELESIFAELPDLKFFQFRGYTHNVDQENMPQHMIDCITQRKPIRFVDIPSHPNVKIEAGNLKLGDGILAMTPDGARWMQEFCQPSLPNIPYEMAFFFRSHLVDDRGIYSVYDKLDALYNEPEYYTHGRITNQWEGQYPYDSPLGKSDIAYANRESDTGSYGHEEWRTVMEAEMENVETAPEIAEEHNEMENAAIHADTEIAERLGCLENMPAKFMNYEGMEFGRYYKAHIFNLPYVNVDVSDRFDYPENDEMAVIICLWENQTEVNRGDRHLYAKSAVYSALSLIENTDVRETGTKIYFVLNEGATDIPLAYLRAANIPESNILYAPLFRSENVEKCHLFSIQAFLHPTLQSKDRVLLFDSDNFVFNADPHFFENLIDRWHPNAWLAVEPDHEPYTYGLEREIYGDKFPDVIRNLMAITGESYEEMDEFTSPQHTYRPNSMGIIYGMSHLLINSPALRGLLEKAYQQDLCFQDESFLYTFCYAENIQESQILQLNPPLEGSYTENMHNYMNYILHLELRPDDDPSGGDTYSDYLSYQADFEQIMTELWRR